MKALYLYNTLTRRKELFTPIRAGEVKMYVCGMTVYDYCHIGHARLLVVFDVVQRWLRTLGYRVIYVRNITDIDDKIIRRAVENNETIQQLTTRFTQYMHEDADRLGVQRPDIEPRAIAFIPQMLSMITRLQEKGLAYQAKDGDVNFSVRHFAAYGKLSGKSLENLRAGERVQANQAKEDPLDFVLWKRAKAGEPEQAIWPSPFGPGRPGWHIECSAMSYALLGRHFDIHGGGQDLQFPHHENEIAQSEGANNHQSVNYWMHNGFVQIDDEKMSKSLGNFFTIRDVLQKYDAEVLRFFLARGHYRSPLNYSDHHLNDAQAGLSRLYTVLRNVKPVAVEIDWENTYAKRFYEAMNDDFNTPIAIAILFELVAEINRTHDARLAGLLKQLANLLGFLQREPDLFLQQKSVNNNDMIADKEIELLIAERKLAKQAKNFQRSDEIRDQLFAQGVVLEDFPGGLTRWRRK